MPKAIQAPRNARHNIGHTVDAQRDIHRRHLLQAFGQSFDGIFIRRLACTERSLDRFRLGGAAAEAALH